MTLRTPRWWCAFRVHNSYTTPMLCMVWTIFHQLCCTIFLSHLPGKRHAPGYTTCKLVSSAKAPFRSRVSIYQCRLNRKRLFLKCRTPCFMHVHRKITRRWPEQRTSWSAQRFAVGAFSPAPWFNLVYCSGRPNKVAVHRKILQWRQIFLQRVLHDLS